MQLEGLRAPCRALVVDDNRDLANNVAELLREEGCEVVVAHGVSDAFERLGDQRCELALVDIRMADGGGLAVLADVKRRYPDAEVVLMTANASLDTAIRAVSEGAFAYLEKPFDPQHMLTLCERALMQVRLRRDREELQRDLARSEALYREVVNSVDALILGLDDEGQIRMSNDAAAATLGYSREDLHGLALPALMASDSARSTFAEVLSGARAGSRTADLELPLCRADGEERLVRFTLSPLEVDKTGESLVLAVGTDMTDRLELERRASEAQAMAAIATLTAGLAHEVRNPLNAASLQLQLLSRQASRLEDGDLRGRIEQRVSIVGEELLRLTKLLDDFLKLAKPQRLDLSAVDLPTLLQEVHAMHAPLAAERGIQLEVVVEHGRVVAQADHGMLKQVLVNLVVNAMDAVGNGGNIVMRCFGQGRSRVAVEVEDSGPGVSEEVRDKLFTPFVTTKEGGTGLGLTIVKRIVDRHGGTITVRNVTGRGAAFRVALQRSHRDGSEPPAPLHSGSSSLH